MDDNDRPKSSSRAASANDTREGGNVVGNKMPSSGSRPSLSSSVSSNTNTSSPISVRHQIGKQLSSITDIINDNLIVVRYTTISTVLLLGGYGVANTPLFYRYKHVFDIPSNMFMKRRWIHGRIVGVAKRSSNSSLEGQSIASTSGRKQSSGVASLLSPTLHSRSTESDNNNYDGDINEQHQHPIVVLFRHSSPMERLLTQSAMDRVLSFTSGKASPSRSLLYRSPNPYRNLLSVELAGIVDPPSTSMSGFASSDDQFTLIDTLIQQKTKVSLQLLAQRTTSSNHENNKHDDKHFHNMTNDDIIQNTAICHLHYKQPKQWFATTNAALEMVQKGQAWINASGMVVPLSNIDADVKDNTKEDPSNRRRGESSDSSIIIGYNPTVKQLQSDTKFISQLEEAEYTAWKSKLGMWSSNQVRELKKEYIEEENLKKSSWSIISLIKRGWDFVRR